MLALDGGYRSSLPPRFFSDSMSNMTNPSGETGVDFSPGVSRRSFIFAAAAAALGAIPALGVSDPAATAPAGVTFGFSTYGMKSLASEEAVGTLAEIGYDSVELAALAGWDADPASLKPDRRTAIRRRLADTGLRLTALMENLPPSVDDARHQVQVDRIKAAAQLAHDLAPDNPPPVETVLGGTDWAKSKPLFVKRLADWVRAAESADAVIAIKPHRGNALSRPEEAVELFGELGNSPQLRMVYDYSHFAGRNMPMADTIRVALPWTVFVSIKDLAIENGREVFKLPGETGQIDYPAMIKQFHAGGYTGDFNCEVSAMISKAADYDALKAAKQCYVAIAPAFDAAGVVRGKRRQAVSCLRAPLALPGVDRACRQQRCTPRKRGR
jgi:sugar phosphate isomerase/epimerase